MRNATAAAEASVVKRGTDLVGSISISEVVVLLGIFAAFVAVVVGALAYHRRVVKRAVKEQLEQD